jgi:hypothetical protein
MSKSKLGKSADDIFAPKPVKQEKPVTVPTIHKEEIVVIKPEDDAKRARGRPQEHKESISKVTVVLLDKQIHWLDQLASNIRFKTKAAVSRAELIRAAIAAIEESELDISHLNSEENIKNFLLEKLKK